MRFHIRPPIGNNRGPTYTESLLNSLSGFRNFETSIGFSNSTGVSSLFVELDNKNRFSFLQELQNAYPGTTVKAKQPKQLKRALYAELRLVPDVVSIKAYDQFLDQGDNRSFSDPISGILSAMDTGNSGKFTTQIRLQIKPATVRRRIHAERSIATASRMGSATLRRWFLCLSTNRRLSFRLIAKLWGFAIKRLIRRADLYVSEKHNEQLFECWLQITVGYPDGAKGKAIEKRDQIASSFARFTEGNSWFELQECKRTNQSPSSRGFLLSAKEIATIWHPLTESVDQTSRVDRPMMRELEPPLALFSKKGRADQTILGQVCFRQQKGKFGIAMDDLRRHMLVIGKTGCGKSTFLLNVVRQQIEANRGVILFDPHGQLAVEVLDIIPKRRTNETIVFDASDRLSPPAFNPLVGPANSDPSLIADGVLTSFSNVFGFDAGSAPRLLHIFRNCLLSLIGTKETSLFAVKRMLVDTNFRKTVVSQVQNEEVRGFWNSEFNQWNDRDRTQYIASLQNKLGAFTTNETLQEIFRPGRKGIVLREVMDSSRILICNLSKGTVGHDASTLLGSLLLSSLQIAAMSRANVCESERPDCLVVIDEFHSYLTDGNTTMADALAESRKYRTSYLLSTQMLDQLDPATRSGVLGNCGSVLCMTMGPTDAQIFEELLGRGLTMADLMTLPKYHGFLRLLTDGVPHTFSINTLPPSNHKPKRGSTIRRISSERWFNLTG